MRLVGLKYGTRSNLQNTISGNTYLTPNQILGTGDGGMYLYIEGGMILGTGEILGTGGMMQQGAQQGHPSPPPPIKQQGAQQGHQSIGGGGDGWQHPDGLDPRSAALAAAERRQGTPGQLMMPS